MGKGIRGRTVDDTSVQRELRRQATPAEVVLWEALRDRRLDGLKFRRQHGLGPFVLDFFCAAHGLVIELDGVIHDYQVEQDAYRTEYLAQYGFRVVRFRNEEVFRDLPSVLDCIRREVAPRSQLLRDEFPSPLPIGGRGEGSGEG
jgi:very-short-patch-repair endonuclease